MGNTNGVLVIVPDPEKIMNAIIGAVKESNVFAIISGGWTAQHADKMEESAGMRADINQHRDSMYYVDSIPHEWLFSQIDAALHHGGAGTTAASIRAGIPTMIKPFFGDQKFWARRVEHLGVGTYVKTFEKEDILRAISRATTDEVQIKQARLLGQNIRLENGVDTAIKAIYEYLDYSQCLIDSTRSTTLQAQPNHLSQAATAVKSAFSSTIKNIHFPRPTTHQGRINDGYSSLV
ncbi:hypothetical protein H4Q26_000400 [Puccinia striiformis f. sp. tritici PST-130]|nr:hypothetical protein H4Q26_000400 [Puccinia striiformis f. sp. tritici PST-130]